MDAELIVLISIGALLALVALGILGVLMGTGKPVSGTAVDAHASTDADRKEAEALFELWLVDPDLVPGYLPSRDGR